MKKILVTGANGFVGTHLVAELKKDPTNEVYSAVSKPKNGENIIAGDLTEYPFSERLIKEIQPDVIYHLAALSIVGSSFSNALKIINDNAAISYNLLEAIRLHAPKARTIAICSANEYGAVTNATRPIDESTPLRPVNPYAVSKVTQEMLALQYHLAYGMDIVILRPFNHTGPGQTTDFVIPKLASQFAQIEARAIPPVIEIGNIDTVRDFTDVRDMVRAYHLAADSALPGEIYNIGSGVGHTIRQIIEILENLTHLKVDLKINTDLVRSADVPVLIANSTKFNEVTNYFPTISLERTVSDILDTFRSKKG